jgi:hypothetical protein
MRSHGRIVCQTRSGSSRPPAVNPLRYVLSARARPLVEAPAPVRTRRYRRYWRSARRAIYKFMKFWNAKRRTREPLLWVPTPVVVGMVDCAVAIEVGREVAVLANAVAAGNRAMYSTSPCGSLAVASSGYRVPWHREWVRRGAGV